MTHEQQNFTQKSINTNQSADSKTEYVHSISAIFDSFDDYTHESIDEANNNNGIDRKQREKTVSVFILRHSKMKQWAQYKPQLQLKDYILQYE